MEGTVTGMARLLRTSCCLTVAAMALALCSCGGPPDSGEAGQSYVLPVYWHGGMWSFDDMRAGIAKKPVTRESNELIDRLVAGIPNASGGFRLILSSQRNSTADVEVVLLEEQDDFCCYRSERLDCMAWFCREALKAFDEAPSTIYMRAERRL